ncbi:MAG: hypothetical protein EAZ97_12480 [Bacteroidetes bacterium]|nr:MAG: hypothetical protein EAZ97_12480 [Bacteroidota bacterium]
MNSKRLFILIFCLLNEILLFAQNDTSTVRQLNLKAINLLQKKQFAQATENATQALSTAEKLLFIDGKAESMMILGDIEQQKATPEKALAYYLEAIRAFESLKKSENLSLAYQKAGNLYQNLQVYDKAINYFNLAYQITPKNNPQNKLINRQLALVFFQKKDYVNAKKKYETVWQETENSNEYFAKTDILNKLSLLERFERNYPKALEYQVKLLKINQENKDLKGILSTLNNLGYLQKQIGDSRKSMDFFKQALTILQESNLKNNSVLLTNIGVIYTNLEDYPAAKQYYLQAQSLIKKKNNPAELAENLNYQAFNNLLAEKNEDALSEANQAVELAKDANSKQILQESYKILSQIYQRIGNFEESQEAFKKHSAILAEIESEKNKQRQMQMEGVLNLEKKESELKLDISDKEKQVLEMQRLQLEADKKAKDAELAQQQITLLKRDQQLQASQLAQAQSEKQRLEAQGQQNQQALLLVQQQLEAEKKGKQIEELESQKQIQESELKRNELFAAMQQDSIKSLETEKNYQAGQLEQEQQIRYYGIGILLLMLIVLGIILYGFRQNQKKNKIIQEKNEQLQVTEEEIRQNLEELAITNEYLQKANDEVLLRSAEAELKSREISLQKEQIEKQHKGITASITYAQRIQAAMLPFVGNITDVFGAENFFIFYKPRDIVSGDFYFFGEMDNKVFVSVADCTGHGVPGALMSMLGMNLLEDLIIYAKIDSPDLILHELNQKIRQMLKQNDSSNRDGMDICVVVLHKEQEKKKFEKITYSGAMNPLFYVKNGEMNEIKATKRPIGGANLDKINSKDFLLHEVPFQKSDSLTLYLCSDGFQDQFGGAEKRKFMSKRFRELLAEISANSMKNQEEKLEIVLKNWVEDQEQTDDITIMGLKIS